MNSKTKTMVGIGLFTAIVVVLQLLGGGIKFTFFSITLVLLPIVVGSAVYSWKAGAWLGFAFGLTVLLTGDAAAFLAIDFWATVFVVLLKGVLCGFVAGIVYALLQKWSDTLAVVTAAVICPIVNTSVFVFGCYVFFFDGIAEWAAEKGYTDVGTYIIVVLVGINFLIELGVNIVLAPIITRLIRIGKR